MRNIKAWFKRNQSDAALISATDKGANALAADEARIAAAEADVQRAQARLGKAVADQRADAERVASLMQEAINAAKTEFQAEVKEYGEDLNEVNQQLVAENEALTAKYLAAKAAAEQKRDAQASALAAKLDAREDELLGELLAASSVLEAAYEVILDPEQP